MSKAACRACGREVYTSSPLEAMFPEERRCPRCGAYLETDRRLDERRHWVRRRNPVTAPGPPSESGERRLEDRRIARRRHDQQSRWQSR